MVGTACQIWNQSQMKPNNQLLSILVFEIPEAFKSFMVVKCPTDVGVCRCGGVWGGGVSCFYSVFIVSNIDRHNLRNRKTEETVFSAGAFEWNRKTWSTLDGFDTIFSLFSVPRCPLQTVLCSHSSELY